MANRYLIASGNYNNTAIWSTTDGGGGGASVPGTSDKVYCTALSGNSTLTVNVESSCAGMDHTGFAGSFVLNALLYIYSGNIIYSPLATYSQASDDIFIGIRGNIQVTTGGNISTPTLALAGLNSSITLVDNCSAKKIGINNNGYFTTNSKNINTGVFVHSNAAIVTITLGSSIITCTSLDLSGTNLTITANTAQFICSGNFAGVANLNLNGASVKFVEVSTKTISGNNTMNQLESDTTAGAHTITLTASSTQTIQKLVVNSEPSKKTTINSTSSTKANLNSINDNFIRNAVLENIAFGGGGVWYYDADTVTVTNCTGLTAKNFPTFNTAKNTFNETKNKFGGNFTAKY